MSGYTPLSEIAGRIADRIRDAGGFKLVTHAQATNGAQLWDMIQSLTNVPCAIVAVGTADFENMALKRTLRPLVFVLAPFRRGLAGDAEGVWELAERVSSCFLPVISEEGADYPEICGIEFVPVSWTPIESPENLSAYSLSLEGTEFLNKE